MIPAPTNPTDRREVNRPPVPSRRRAGRQVLAAAACLTIGAVALGMAQEAGQEAGQESRSKPVYLDEAMVNVIKQSELTARDTDIRFRFRNNLKREFPKTQADLTYEQFRQGTDLQQALYILENGTADQKADVMVLGDPYPLEIWREEIEPVVLQGCATSSCHGTANAADAHGLFLYPNPRPEAAHYTNFYTLASYQKQAEKSDDALFGGGMEKMINRQQPEQSLLLQYALPPETTDRPHPPVPGAGYDGLVRDTTDPRFGMIVRWIELLDGTRDLYDVNFTIPGTARQTGTNTVGADTAASDGTPSTDGTPGSDGDAADDGTAGQ